MRFIRGFITKDYVSKGAVKSVKQFVFFFQVFIMDDLALVSMKNAVKGET